MLTSTSDLSSIEKKKQAYLAGERKAAEFRRVRLSFGAGSTSPSAAGGGGGLSGEGGGAGATARPITTTTQPAPPSRLRAHSSCLGYKVVACPLTQSHWRRGTDPAAPSDPGLFLRIARRPSPGPTCQIADDPVSQAHTLAPAASPQSPETRRSSLLSTCFVRILERNPSGEMMSLRLAVCAALALVLLVDWSTAVPVQDKELLSGLNQMMSEEENAAMERDLLNYLMGRRFVKRLRSQPADTDDQRKRNYWRQCAFNAVSCFGKKK